MKLQVRFIGAICVFVLSLVFATSAVAGAAFAGDKVPRMEIKELLSKVDSSDVLIIDVRRGSDWKGSEKMIKNAVRKAYNDVGSWAGEMPKDKTLVLYCA
ncbi:MAG: rhodanese-like domain-containing protein [Pseudodesulfovibrio sp.]